MSGGTTRTIHPQAGARVVVLYREDFRYGQFFDDLLQGLGFDTGEAVDWDEIETLTLTVTTAEGKTDPEPEDLAERSPITGAKLEHDAPELCENCPHCRACGAPNPDLEVR